MDKLLNCGILIAEGNLMKLSKEMNLKIAEFKEVLDDMARTEGKLTSAEISYLFYTIKPNIPYSEWTTELTEHDWVKLAKYSWNDSHATLLEEWQANGNRPIVIWSLEKRKSKRVLKNSFFSIDDELGKLGYSARQPEGHKGQPAMNLHKRREEPK